MSDELSEIAARHGVAAVESYLARGRLRPVRVLVCVATADDDGAVVGLLPGADPAALLHDLLEFSTIVAAAVGKHLVIVDREKAP